MMGVDITGAVRGTRHDPIRVCLGLLTGTILIACSGGATGTATQALPPITIDAAATALGNALTLRGSAGLTTSYPLNSADVPSDTLTEIPGTPAGISLPVAPPEQQQPGLWHLIDSATFAIAPQPLPIPGACDLDVFDPKPAADDPFAGYIVAFFDVTNRTASFVASANGDRLTQLGIIVSCSAPPVEIQWTAKPAHIYVAAWYRDR